MESIMRAKSALKKYAKLNDYQARSYSVPAFIKHLSMKFEFSEAELRQAVKSNKIRIYYNC